MRSSESASRRVRTLERPSGGVVEERRIDEGVEHAIDGQRDGATVVICLDGVGTAALERETYLMRAGFIAILRGAVTLRIGAGPRGVRWLSLRWPERSLQALGPPKRGLERTRALYGRASVGLAWRISEELRVKDSLAPWAVDVMAGGIAVALTRGSRRHPPTPALATRARRAIDRAGYGNISLAKIARELGCSPEHLSRLFRRSFGLTPSRYAMWRRIEQAKRMLLAGTRPVSDIGIELGFSDASHFGRHFRAWTGVSPARFRENRG
ncbi:MAG TPA: AraC family transcriptional regulator [Gemmatimonadaceae bacterium]|nr:AraC family transcriptional regulator [Gemmatimonadaceae bacterium]